MLIGCITGPDLETAKRQLESANTFCDGVELRKDLLKAPIEVCDKFLITTEGSHSVLSDGRTLSSYHNFAETPEDLEGILQRLPPADIYKIATMANKTTDALRMLAFAKNKPHVAGMCMGALGQITRILGPVVENPFTFAALGTKAAPGQLQAEELVQTYRFHKLSSQTKIYGLIGQPVSHSLGHLFHNAFFEREGIDAVYVRMELKEEELPLFFSLAKELNFSGLSVTRPFKEKLGPYIDIFEEEAKEIGAVNTVTWGASVYGGNTDGKGALDALEEKIPVSGKQIVILGTGGASKAIAYEAKKRGGLVTILSRRYENLNRLPFYDILINTTPIPCPIDLKEIKPHKVIMDITVGHKESPLMRQAKALGCTLIYGQEMFEKRALGQLLRWGIVLDKT